MSIEWMEDGDDVDLAEGEWQVLYLYHLPAEDAVIAPRFVGYLTLYGFNNPVKGKGLRVCQVIVLPSHQRKGEELRVGGGIGV